MRIKKFNEGLSNLNYETFDFFDLIVTKLKNNKGYTVFSYEKEDLFCKSFNFATKEEFDMEFSITKHSYYPGNILTPKNIVRTENGHVDYCVIDGQQFTIDINELYLMVDGKLVR
jgi:hypothetical protein